MEQGRPWSRENTAQQWHYKELDVLQEEERKSGQGGCQETPNNI